MAKGTLKKQRDVSLWGNLLFQPAEPFSPAESYGQIGEEGSRDGSAGSGFRRERVPGRKVLGKFELDEGWFRGVALKGRFKVVWGGCLAGFKVGSGLGRQV